MYTMNSSACSITMSHNKSFKEAKCVGKELLGEHFYFKILQFSQDMKFQTVQKRIKIRKVIESQQMWISILLLVEVFLLIDRSPRDR